MALNFSLGVALLLSMWAAARCDPLPEGVLQMECHERFFVIAVDLSFTGENPHFEAVDKTGEYAITQEYAAKCGYSVGIRPLLGYVWLRASYFSCHTENKNDKAFTLNFNLITDSEGKEVTLALNKTCSPSLPWSPREITCEVNYMEVLLESDISCGIRQGREDGESPVTPVPRSTTSDWQVVFQVGEEQMPPMNLSGARKQGYVFDMTDRMIVFRTPYGQPDSFPNEVDGIEVETVHATLFSKQGWVVFMVEVVAACSKSEGSYESGYMIWKTPEALYPGLHTTHVKLGLHGELLEEKEAVQNGYLVDMMDGTIAIGIPADAEGVFRKSYVEEYLYEFYIFHFYFEQLLLDEELVETSLRFAKFLVSPLLHRPLLAENRTVLEERVFTVSLGDIPEDVKLTSLALNGHTCEVQCANTSSYNLTKVVQPNNTHGYILTLPFEDFRVIKEFFKEDSVLEYRLDINYTLTVEAQNDPYYHLTSIVAAFTDVSPPTMYSVCAESGMSFQLEHKPFNHLWEVVIGSDVLTPELVEQNGYILQNNSQILLLDVPLFTPGYIYTDVSLNGFFGTFELLVRDVETSEIQTSTVKTCAYTSDELIMCSMDGRMTVVADVSLAVPAEGFPASTALRDQYCSPKEADDTRVHFSFPLSTCGTIVKIGKKEVTYQNEIFYKNYYNNKPLVADNTTERVIVQCTYPMESLQQLFSKLRFESDVVGVGKIIHTKQPTAGLKPLAIKQTMAPQTTLATKKPSGRFAYKMDDRRRNLFKVSKLYNRGSSKTKGTDGSSETKPNIVQV